MIPEDRFNKYQHYLNEFHLFSINPMVALNYHSFSCKSYKVLFLCTKRLESFSATKIVSGAYKTTTKKKGLSLASRLCPSRTALPSAPAHCHTEPRTPRAGREFAPFAGRGAGAAPRCSPDRNASAAAEVAGGPLIPRKRGGQSGPAGLWRGVASAAVRPWSGQEPAVRVPGCFRGAVRRPLSRAGCSFWLWAARGRPDCGSAGRGRRCGRPPRCEAPGRPSRGRPPAAAPGGLSAAGVRDCARPRRFSLVPCERRWAVPGLADPRKGGSRWV